MNRPAGPIHTWPRKARNAYKAAIQQYRRGKGPHPGTPRPRWRLSKTMPRHLWEALDAVPLATLNGYQGA